MVIWKRRNPKRKFRDYTKYKPWLREDFKYACVYCTVHEGEFGGFHSFHVEHFKPKSKFPELIIEYTNLLYACWKCNSLKGEDWPSDNPLKSGKGYLDPCRYDYEKYFILNNDGILVGKNKAATYMIERLHLNSYFLIKIRNEREKICESIKKYELPIREIDTILKHEKSASKIKSLENIKSDILSLLEVKKAESDKRFSPPYEPQDLR